MHPNDSIIKLYKNGIGTNELARCFNLHRSTIQRILQRGDIELRKRAPSFLYDVKFFDSYNPRSVYWAGFILADGYIRDDRAQLHIKLMKSDLEHLEKFKKITKFTGPVHMRDNYVSIDFSGKWFPEALRENFDITARKTYVATLTEKIPRTMISHFIRGIIDGDGSLGKSRPSVSLVGTKALLSKLTLIIKEEIGINLRSGNDVPPIYDRSEHIGSVSYGDTNAKKILAWIYKGSRAETRLDRKYEIWRLYHDRKRRGYEKVHT